MVNPGPQWLSPKVLAGPGVFLACFLVYLLTLAPTVTFWDSGELVTSAVCLGNPHPPAYPLFCLLGKGFFFIPMGNAAYRVNLLSAVFGAAASYMIFRLVRGSGKGVPGALWLAASAGLSLAFIKNLWSVAVVSEVYALNSFLLACIAYLLFLYDTEKRPAFLHASAFLLGLAFVNHQSVLVFIPVYLAFYLLSDKNYKNLGVAARSLFFFLLGCSVLLYIPVRAATSPLLNIGDARYVSNFVELTKWPNNVKAIEGILHRLPTGRILILVLAAAISAAAVYLFRKRRFTLMLAFSSLFYYVGITALTGGAEGIKKWGLQGKFFGPAVLFFVPVAAEVCSYALRALRGRAALGAASLLMMALPAGLLINNYKDMDNSRNFFAVDFGANTLKSLKQDAALFAWGDNGIFPVWYLQGVEHYREDVLFVHTALLTYPWYVAEKQAEVLSKYGIRWEPEATLDMLRTNVGYMKLALNERAPTYFDFSTMEQLEVPMLELQPQGLVQLAVPWGPAPLSRIWERYILRGAFDGSTNKAFAAEGILDIYAWESAVWAGQAYQAGLRDEALFAYSLARQLGMSNRRFEELGERISNMH